MLSKPEAGWTTFQLDGTDAYELSYISDIAFDWLKEAIHGLKTGQPFRLDAYKEPGAMWCVVSAHYCYLINKKWCEESGETYPVVERSDLSMVSFCKELIKDIEADKEGWAFFQDFLEKHDKWKMIELEVLLKRLRKLVAQKEKMIKPTNWEEREGTVSLQIAKMIAWSACYKYNRCKEFLNHYEFYNYEFYNCSDRYLQHINISKKTGEILDLKSIHNDRFHEIEMRTYELSDKEDKVLSEPTYLYFPELKAVALSGSFFDRDKGFIFDIDGGWIVDIKKLELREFHSISMQEAIDIVTSDDYNFHFWND